MEDDENNIRVFEEQEEEEERNEDILKKRISCHPLYALLVQTHLEFLKVGDINVLERSCRIVERESDDDDDDNSSLSLHNKSELDHFMEAYCLTLSKLKEAMEEPQRESMEFINDMHSKLTQLTTSDIHSAQPSSSSSVKESTDAKCSQAQL